MYDTVALDGEEIQFRDVGGRTMKLPVHVNIADLSTKLVECDLCYDQIRLGNGRSTHTFLLHCGLGACQKTTNWKGKKHAMDAEKVAISEAWQALQKLLHKLSKLQKHLLTTFLTI